MRALTLMQTERDSLAERLALMPKDDQRRYALIDTMKQYDRQLEVLRLQADKLENETSEEKVRRLARSARAVTWQG